MSSAVLAAAIGVGGTVIVGVAGFGAGIWTTHRTIGADREARIWDRRAAAYVDAITLLGNRRVRRDLETRTRSVDQASQIRARDYLESGAALDRHAVNASLNAFGSHLVIAAAQASTLANDATYQAFRDWQAAAVAGGAEEATAREALHAARDVADERDKAVLERIRYELHGVMTSIPLYQLLPPVGLTQPHLAVRTSSSFNPGAGNQVHRQPARRGSKTGAGSPLEGHTGWVNAVAAVLLPGGQVLLASGGEDGTLRLWDPVTATPACDPLGRPHRLGDRRCGGAAARRPVLPASASSDHTVRLWDPATRTPVAVVHLAAPAYSLTATNSLIVAAAGRSLAALVHRPVDA